jgi:AcrR family transcriptional regulator
MHSMHYSSETGLRERKKLATRQAIERAAVRLALEDGYEVATAEAISRRADVSLRTFFNYFPSKDAAIVGPGIHLTDQQQALRILEEAGAHLLKGIARVAEASVAALGPTSDIMQERRLLLRREPRLMHMHMNAVIGFEAELTSLLAHHLCAHPERRRLARQASVEEEAGIAVAIVGSAIRCSMERWSATDDDVTLHSRDIERTIDMMAEIHVKDR